MEVLQRELVREVMIMAGPHFCPKTLKRSIRRVTGLRQTVDILTKSVVGVDLGHTIGRGKCQDQGLLRWMSFRSEGDIVILVGIIFMTELTQ